ncbi:hypothetical protein GCM10018952_60680 [Streptosporangium vulgare]
MPAQIASAPAARARTAISPGEWRAATARISMASVTIIPVKPISSRSSPVVIRRLSVAGFSGSRAGISRCPHMTARTPAATAVRKGGRSRSARSRGEACRVGRAWWESVWVSPWPGKCLAQAATPAPWSPEIQAAVCRETSSGSAPKERTPITGLTGLALTSATGA